MEDYLRPSWAGLLPEGEKISTRDSLLAGRQLDMFEKFKLESENTGDITYYLYDPTKHGADKNKKYPMIVFFHGLSNALNGRLCVSYSGAELFASEAYQEKLGGGAYVLVPLANEKRVNKKIEGSWSKEYFEPVRKLIDKIRAENGVGKLFAVGGSMGGWFTWRFSEINPIFSGIIPISAPYVPSRQSLEKFRERGTRIYYAIGQHDEYIDFRSIAPKAKMLDEFENVMYWFPEWVRNGDGGVASLNSGGEEMGQHCLIIQVQGNLIFDDGTPYDERLPEGITGWMRKIIEE